MLSNTENKELLKVVRMNKTDRRIMTVLHKLPWAMDYHIALLIGEPVRFVKRRLQQLQEKKLVKRVQIAAGFPACNYITSKGISEAGLEPRTVNAPSFYTFEHDLGCIDSYVYLSLYKTKNGSYYTDFGNVITERDFQSVREMEEVGRKSDGTPIYKNRFEGHEPDGYIIRPNGRYYSFEFERVMKSKKSNSQLEDNIIDNCKRFDRQIWIYGNNQVGKKLQQVKSEVPDMDIISISKVREYLDMCIEELPVIISKKSGVAPNVRIGETISPTPLSQLPLRNSVKLEPVSGVTEGQKASFVANQEQQVQQRSLNLE